MIKCNYGYINVLVYNSIGLWLSIYMGYILRYLMSSSQFMNKSLGLFKIERNGHIFHGVQIETDLVHMHSRPSNNDSDFFITVQHLKDAVSEGRISLIRMDICPICQDRSLENNTIENLSLVTVKQNCLCEDCSFADSFSYRRD